MKKTLLLLSLTLTAFGFGSAHAGDAAAGAAAFAAKGCIGCHGAAGKAPIGANFPVVGGKPAEFISGELTKFRSGERKEPTMNAMAAALSDDDIANLAAYLSAQ